MENVNKSFSFRNVLFDQNVDIISKNILTAYEGTCVECRRLIHYNRIGSCHAIEQFIEFISNDAKILVTSDCLDLTNNPIKTQLLVG